MSEIRNSMMHTMAPFLAPAIAVIVVGLLAGFSVLGAKNSANLISGTTYLLQFMAVIGLAVGIGLMIRAMDWMGGGGRRGH